MPTYAYACTACDHRFEVQQSFSEASLSDCPACTGRLRKLFNSVGIVFKGSGFYRTDSRSGTASGTKPAGTGSSAGTGASAGSGSGDSSASTSSGTSGGASTAGSGASTSGSSSSGGTAASTPSTGSAA